MTMWWAHRFGIQTTEKMTEKPKGTLKSGVMLHTTHKLIHLLDAQNSIEPN